LNADAAVSGRRETDRTALSVGGIREARADIIARELRKVRQELFLGHADGQVPEHIADCDTSAANDGLAESDFGIEHDALMIILDSGHVWKG